MRSKAFFAWERRSAQATHELADGDVEHDVTVHQVVLELVNLALAKRTCQPLADVRAHVGPCRLPVLARLGTQAAQIWLWPRTRLYVAGEVA